MVDVGRPPNKKWFIKTEKLKLEISEYNNQFLLILTFLLTFVAIKPDITFLKVIFIVSLLFMIDLIWKRNKKENQLTEHFEGEESKSSIWKYDLTILTIIAYIVLVIYIWFNIQWVLFILLGLVIFYLILSRILIKVYGS